MLYIAHNLAVPEYFIDTFKKILHNQQKYEYPHDIHVFCETEMLLNGV